MEFPPIETRNLRLVFQTRDEARANVAEMQSQGGSEVSAAWLALLDGSSLIDPWIHGFVLVQRDTGSIVGRCGFKGPPDHDGMVEIAYYVAPEHEGKGYATEAAAALTSYAFSHEQVRVVRAHTLATGVVGRLPSTGVADVKGAASRDAANNEIAAEENASARVLTKCGFRRVGEIVDPEDGLVWRWERAK
jgi:RimJ/RimL family protein N-acetyltransferase